MAFSRWWRKPETLYRSNMKYQPQWIPRFACSRTLARSPASGQASAIAEGFLVLPFRRKEHTGEHVAAPQNLVDSGISLHRATAAPRMSVRCSRICPPMIT